MNLLARSTQKPKEFSDFEYNWTEYSNDFFPSIFLLTPLLLSQEILFTRASETPPASLKPILSLHHMLAEE